MSPWWLLCYVFFIFAVTPNSFLSFFVFHIFMFSFQFVFPRSASEHAEENAHSLVPARPEKQSCLQHVFYRGLDLFKLLCDRVINEVTVLPMQEVFLSGDDCNGLDGAISGSGFFDREFLGPVEIHDSHHRATPIYQGQWLSEMALRTKWNHTGSLTASNAVKLVKMHCDVFRSLALNARGATFKTLKTYAPFMV